jgi:hypothetical protein
MSSRGAITPRPGRHVKTLPVAATGPHPRSLSSDKKGVKDLAAAAILAAPLLIVTQQQATGRRADWPCGARLDPTYFQMAEGTGGHLLLLSPEEMADSVALLTAFDSHPQTIFRLAGSLTPGPHEFKVPIDSSVESVLFSTSVQCLRTVDFVRPSGLAPSGDDVTNLLNFRAERMVIVKRPEPGIWTVAVSGSGVAGVVVQARTAITISEVQFAPGRSGRFSPIPSAGIENALRIRLSGHASDVRASLVSGVFQPVAELPLEANEPDGSYLSRFTPGADGFRVLIAGRDSDGKAFQRMSAALIIARR